jgi:hypothetical protein
LSGCTGPRYHMPEGAETSAIEAVISRTTAMLKA